MGASAAVASAAVASAAGWRSKLLHGRRTHAAPATTVAKQDQKSHALVRDRSAIAAATKGAPKVVSAPAAKAAALKVAAAKAAAARASRPNASAEPPPPELPREPLAPLGPQASALATGWSMTAVVVEERVAWPMRAD